MRIIHFADLHLGIDSHGRLDPRTGLSTRVQDFLDRLDDVVRFAVSTNADAVLFAGDAFKSRDPNPTLQRAFATRIRELTEHRIPIVLLVGNHDLPGIVARATAMEIYDALAIPGVYVARNVERIQLDTLAGPLDIVALPWIATSTLQRDESSRRMEPEESRRWVSDQIAAGIAQLASEMRPDAARVLLAHVSVEGARLGSEQSIMLGRDLVLSTEQLSIDSFDYVALGHIHSHQSVTARPPSVYAGSLERIDFGEERDTKGFVEVTIDLDAESPRRAEWAFHELPARRFLTIRVDATGRDPARVIEREISRRADDIRGAIVRCRISVAAGHEDQVRVNDVRSTIESLGAYSVAQVSLDAPAMTRLRISIQDDQAQDAGYLLEQWLELRDLPEATRQRIHARGLDIIRSHYDEPAEPESPSPKPD